MPRNLSKATYRKGASDLAKPLVTARVRHTPVRLSAHETMRRLQAVEAVRAVLRNRNSKDGRHSYCKECNNARSRESRQRLHGSARHYHLKHRYGTVPPKSTHSLHRTAIIVRSADARCRTTLTTTMRRAVCVGS